MNKTFKERPYFRIKDLAVLGLVLAVSAAGFIMWGLKTDSKTPAYAEIRVNSQLVKTISLENLNEPVEITIEGNFPVTLEASCEGIRFIHSDCPDKLCIHSGLLGSGQSAACLPAGVSVSVKSNSSSEIDAVVG